jgi:phage shock protein E
MARFFKLLAGALAALLLVGTASACSSVSTVDVATYASVIDVRTPEEYATGHLAGATNIDIRGISFADQIGKLDRGANYFIYCHSGNRAGQAIDYMVSNGFTGTLTNGGGVDAAAKATGLAIVKN